MVNTKNKGSPISAITTHYKYTRKRRLSPILAHHKPQYIMGKSTPKGFNSPNMYWFIYSSFNFRGGDSEGD